jgi:hypothetical protein
MKLRMTHHPYAQNVRGQRLPLLPVVELTTARQVAGCGRGTSFGGFDSQLKRILTTSRDVLGRHSVMLGVPEIHAQNVSPVELAAMANTRSLLTKI